MAIVAVEIGDVGVDPDCLPIRSLQVGDVLQWYRDLGIISLIRSNRHGTGTLRKAIRQV